MKTPAPRWVCLQLLQACNLRCSMCYEWGKTGVHKKAVAPAELPFDVVERIIDEVAPYRPHIDLFGGEPLLYPQLGSVIERGKRGGCTVDLVTNGTALEEQADFLVHAGLDRLFVSLDGPQPINDRQRGKGTFSRVERGLAALGAARARRGVQKPRIGITFVVTTANHHAIAETFLTALDRRDIDFISIEYQSYLLSDQLDAYRQLLRDRFATEAVRFAVGLVRDPAEFSAIDVAGVSAQIETVREVYESEGKHVITHPRVTTVENSMAYFAGRFEAMSDYHRRCVFPWLYAEVSASGDVTPCHTFYDLTFGNVKEQSLLEIWRGERFEDARRFFRNNLSPVCHACCLYHTDLAPS